MKLIDLFEDVLPQRKIVQWAVGLNADKASRAAAKDMQDPVYTVVWLPIKDVMEHTLSFQRLDISDPVGGENSIGPRVARSKEHWEAGGFMDPSLLSIDASSDSVIVFSDGRHRMVAAHQLGETWAPAIVPKEHLVYIQRLMTVKTARPSMLESILNEGHKVVHKTWHHPASGRVVIVTSGEHWTEVDDHPSKFGLPPTHEVNHFSVIADMVDDGWVRASYEIPFSNHKIMFAEGINLRDLRQVVRYYIKRYPEIEKVILNTRGEYDSPQLEGNQIDQFARTGRIQKERVAINENIEDSIYGSWYDTNTNKLYELGPYGGGGASPHEAWLLENLELIGETKESLMDKDFEYIYRAAKNYGLVRVIYPESDARFKEYSVEGWAPQVKMYLKRYHRQIVQLVKSNEIEVIVIELGEDTEEVGRDTLVFNVDRGAMELRKFNQFVMS